MQGLVAGLCHIHDEAMLLQSLSKKCGNFSFILVDQDSHRFDSRTFRNLCHTLDFAVMYKRPSPTRRAATRWPLTALTSGQSRKVENLRWTGSQNWDF